MQNDAAFLAGLDRVGGVLAALPDEALTRASPCDGWSGRDLLGHLVGMVEAGTAIVRGLPPDFPGERPGDVLGDDEPRARWERAATAAREALRDADVDALVSSPRGPQTIREGLAFPALDLHLHAWDLGRCGDVDVELESEVVAFVRAFVEPLPDDAVRAPTVFGPEQPAPPEATETEALLAWTGRRVRA